jgi:hypothetical protein
MSYGSNQDKPRYVNQGIAGPNKHKHSDKHPDITGTLNVAEAGEHYLSVWKRDDGRWSIKIQPRSDKGSPQSYPASSDAPSTYTAQMPKPAAPAIEEDDIPF